jgi:nitrogen fixation/metabolism regulation signal transduction histidine kinase
VVLENVLKLLTNLMFLRMTAGLLLAGFSFLVGVITIRRIRRSFAADPFFDSDLTSPESLSLHTYSSVIQQLKQQKHELQSSQQSERRRARTSENISAAVLSNLSSGVLFFTPNGLVRQANGASKQILGFASPSGMTATEIFRQAQLTSPSSYETLSQAIEASLHDRTPSSRLQAQYVSPSGEQRIIEVTVTPVRSSSADCLGTACLISDQTEMATIRKHEQLRGEISSEMALELRNSLNTISGYARQLADGGNTELTKRVASDIVSEASHLDHTIGGFLAGNKKARAAGA